MSPHVKEPEVTRAKILQVAMEEIHMHGFQGVSLNKIVEKAGVTKGALFHHFKGKSELGYAVVDEVISKEINEFWINPMSNSVDPVGDLKKLRRRRRRCVQHVIKLIILSQRLHLEHARFIGCSR